MRKPIRDWWTYATKMIRQYPGRKGRKLQGTQLAEQRAVESAIREAEALPNGEARLKLIDLVHWKRTHNLEGAAVELHFSEATAKRYHGDFVRAVGRNFRCDRLE